MSNSKLNYPVQFPLNNLNVKRFLSTNKLISNENEIYDDEQEDFIEEDDDDERQYGLYDLFAVCNHRGSMSNGHYTAYCKNPITGKWFCYDDHLVSELDPSRVCTPDAYILFYKLRDTSPSHSISQSSSSQQQIDLMANDFDEYLNLDQQSSIENKKPQYILQPPLPLPRRLLTSSSQDECSSAPCPLPRTRVPQYEIEIISQPTLPIRRQIVHPISRQSSMSTESTNDFYTDRISPWSRFNNQRYSNDEPERNVIYYPSIS